RRPSIFLSHRFSYRAPSPPAFSTLSLHDALPISRAALAARGTDVRLEAVHGRLQPDLVRAMNAADVLLLPSFHEGSPNVVKEAMAVNLPVVAARVGDCVERLRGVLPSAVVDRTPEAFAEAAAPVLASGAPSDGREAID